MVRPLSALLPTFLSTASTVAARYFNDPEYLASRFSIASNDWVRHPVARLTDEKTSLFHLHYQQIVIRPRLARLRSTIRQNSVIVVVGEFVIGIDTAKQRNVLNPCRPRKAIFAMTVCRGSIDPRPAIVTFSRTGNFKRLPGQRHPRKLQWQYTHADQVRTVNTFKRLHDHSAHAEQTGSLGSPVTA